ncbi:MAG: excinuclease ABC subunit B [Verrucomicrobiota bacterium]
MHLTQIISGKMQKIDLCEKCAKEKGVADPAGFSLADMLLGLGAADEIKAPGNEELVCPQCGFTQPDFKKTGAARLPAVLRDFLGGSRRDPEGHAQGRHPQGQDSEPGPARAGVPEPAQVAAREFAERRAGRELRAGAALRDQITHLEMQLKG